jgi:carbamoyltransferase
MKQRNILAVHAGHNASAAVMRDGVITTAALEERFCRKKNYVGYPKQAIDYCLRAEGLRGADFERIAYTTTNFQGLFIKAKTSTQFSLRDYMDYHGERYFSRKLRGENTDDYLRWLNTAEQFNRDQQYYDFSYLTEEVMLDPKRDIELFRNEMRRALSAQLAVEPARIEFLDHHTCHAYYAYFGSPFRGKDCIALTLDGWGDGRNQTVWKVSDDRLELLAESAQNEIGRIYKLATLILAMRPDEHEFKVMGMAPYAKDSYVAKTMKLIEDIIDVDGMRIVHKKRPTDLYRFLREVWVDHRFDNIAGAVQAYTEQISTKLVRNIVRETGISRLVMSGGISMNVKMNKAVGDLPEVSELFVCGSGGGLAQQRAGTAPLSGHGHRSRSSDDGPGRAAHQVRRDREGRPRRRGEADSSRRRRCGHPRARRIRRPRARQPQHPRRSEPARFGAEDQRGDQESRLLDAVRIVGAR